MPTAARRPSLECFQLIALAPPARPPAACALLLPRRKPSERDSGGCGLWPRQRVGPRGQAGRWRRRSVRTEPAPSGSMHVAAGVLPTPRGADAPPPARRAPRLNRCMRTPSLPDVIGGVGRAWSLPTAAPRADAAARGAPRRACPGTGPVPRPDGPRAGPRDRRQRSIASWRAGGAGARPARPRARATRLPRRGRASDQRLRRLGVP
jgi:hypothetical protein